MTDLQKVKDALGLMDELLRNPNIISNVADCVFHPSAKKAKSMCAEALSALEGKVLVDEEVLSSMPCCPVRLPYNAHSCGECFYASEDSLMKCWTAYLTKEDSDGQDGE